MVNLLERYSDPNNFLIKFRSLDNESQFQRVKDILENDRFYMSSLNKLNDSFEGIGTHIVRDPKEYLKRLAQNRY